MPKQKKLKVRVQRDLLQIASDFLVQSAEIPLPEANRIALDRVSRHFRAVLNRTKEHQRCHSLAEYYQRRRKPGTDKGQDWFFAIRVNDEDEKRYELYLCLKSEWYNCRERFPWRADWPHNPTILEALAGAEERDSGLIWYNGDAEMVEERRQQLLAVCMEERPAILTALRTYPPDREEEGDWACDKAEPPFMGLR